ncbi:MAG: cell division protein ZapA [Candidatus Kapabacteria bacterium]|jgi:cell division protein ZapA (FtsZ GTPase activity inhibitor)|nr:cell division protein ZapA [Candidatus Kapabacteria bacterium]
MAKNITVTIADEDLSFKGDDEAMVRKAAGEVDQQIKTLKAGSKESSRLLSILAAMNIAEDKINALSQSESDKNYLIDEFSKMEKYLDDNFKL